MRFDDEQVAWHFEIWKWLLENFEAHGFFSSAQLVAPTREAFPFAPSLDHSYFQAVFDRVRALMGLEDWPCLLEPLEDGEAVERLDRWSLLEGQRTTAGAAGHFDSSSDLPVIRYAPALVENPGALVATFAHELCHYLLATARTAPPGGWGDHEYHTDIASVFCGFGIFVCNAAFSFEQWGDAYVSGWRASSHGYLPESELAYDLAIFCHLKETPPKSVVRMLKRNPRTYFKRALKDLRGREDLLNSLYATPHSTRWANKGSQTGG